MSLLADQQDGDIEMKGSDMVPALKKRAHSGEEDRPVRKQLEKNTSSAQRSEQKGDEDRGSAGPCLLGQTRASEKGREHST